MRRASVSLGLSSIIKFLLAFLALAGMAYLIFRVIVGTGSTPLTAEIAGAGLLVSRRRISAIFK
jgi:hypothetical protein